jgi:FG-GAP repeat/Lectin C-type domain
MRGSTALAATAVLVLTPVPTYGQCQLHHLVASDGAPNDYFGIAVALDADNIVVGAVGWNSNQGKAYVFDVASGQERYSLVAPGGLPGDEFGRSVAVSDSHVLVGARNANGTGLVYVFETDSGQLKHRLQPPPGSLNGIAFGWSLSAQGDLCLVGAPGAQEAYLYDLVSGQGLGVLSPTDPSPVDFGRSVALDGSLAIVGDPEIYPDGAAYIFGVPAGNQLFKLEPSQPSSSSKFGFSVALHAGVAVIGDPYDQPLWCQSGQCGSLYVFDATQGQETYKLDPTSSHPGDLFAFSVALNSDRILTGEPGDGVATVFELTTGSVLNYFVKSGGTSTSVAIMGDRGLAGSPYENTMGAVYVLEIGFRDCNNNGQWDCEDILSGASTDDDKNGLPDECEWKTSPVNNHWYKPLPEVSWHEAEAQAQAWTGHLATIRSQSENDWVATTFASGGVLWIGFSDEDQEGFFEWASGEAITFENWASGQPDDSQGADWTVLDPSTGLWRDEPDLPPQTGLIEVISDDCDGNALPDTYEIKLAPGLDWNGDGVLDECLPANYCLAAPNSTGLQGVIGASGTPVVTDNEFALDASDLPPNEFAYFLASESTAFVPGFGGSSGNLCLGPPIIRLNLPGMVLNTGSTGTVSLTLDLLNLAQGIVLSPGDTWYFQLWFRDWTGGPTSNTTDGIEVMFR